MSVTKIVRIIQTCDVEVAAEFGDTPVSLCDKAEFDSNAAIEDRVLLPDDYVEHTAETEEDTD